MRRFIQSLTSTVVAGLLVVVPVYLATLLLRKASVKPSFSRYRAWRSAL